MNQMKIGKFIAERRKAQNLTQMQLAEKLGITDRAVSKWERGKALPDASLMLPLCEILQITVNDLLSGEVVLVENYNKELENKLIEMVKEKEKRDKQLLQIEVVTGVICIVVMLALCAVASYAPMAEWLRILLIVVGVLPFLIACPFMLKIEQVAGYYECRACGHRHIPKYGSVFMAMHYGRTRYMQCPACRKRSWQRKVLKKED